MNRTSNSRSVSTLSATDDFNESRQLSDLIGVIYDAAIDASLWDGALERVADFVGGSGAGLFCKDVGVLLATIPHAAGFARPLPSPALFQQISSAVEGHFVGDLETPIATTDLMPFTDYERTDLYRQWAEPLGVVDFLTAVVDRTTISSAVLGVFRHARNGLVDDAARRQMRLIAPHVRRAVLIGKMFECASAEVATFVDTLDGLAAGMFLVDAAGRLVHANAAGHAILGQNDILSLIGERLVAGNALADRTLRDVFAAAGQGDAALGVKGIALPLIGRDGERYVAHALPLTSGARRRAGVVYTAAVALFVRRASLGMSSVPEAIGSAFKLTPTELRVLLAIVEVGGVPEVAMAFGVAETTVRTHVGRLFEKTGTSRQADLVKLVAGYATPLGE
jgi:DNA-binding CsgD family transcriptional regulator/PAS domain-containing protein